jgi:DNA polymerase III epsilon subunit-like protein
MKKNNFGLIMESWRGFKSVLNERTIPEKDYPRTFQELQSAYKEFEGKTLIFFDTETTGLEMEKKFSAVTQLAAIKVNGASLLGDGEVKVQEEFDKRIELAGETKSEIAQQEKTWKFRIEKYNEEKQKFEEDQQKKKQEDPNHKIQKFSRPKPFSIAMAFAMTGYKTTEELEKQLGCTIVSVEPEIEAENPAHGEEGRQYFVPDEVLEGFVKFCSPIGKNILIAKNAPFDVKYLNVAFRRAGIKVPEDFVVDTDVIFRKYLIPVLVKIKNDIDQDPNFIETLDEQTKFIINTLFTGTYNRYTDQPNFTIRLGEITKAFKIPDEGWHNALADVKMTAKVMKAINNYLLKKQEVTSTINYEDPVGPYTETESEILSQIEQVEKQIEELNAQGIGGDSPIDEPKGKGYKFKDIKTGKEIVKADTPEYAEYAKLYEPLDAAKKKLTSLKAKLEDIRDPEKAQAKKEKRRQQDAERRATKKDTPPISESKIRIKIKR